MKFIVSSTSLLKQLQLLQGVLASSNTLPILNNFLLEIDGKQLTLTASDLETTITATMPVEAKDKGSVAIPARLLLNTLKAFPRAAAHLHHRRQAPRCGDQQRPREVQDDRLQRHGVPKGRFWRTQRK